jgi:hypothetical protein
MAGLEKERRDFLMAHPYREFAAKHPAAPVRRLRSAAIGSRWVPAAMGLAACLVLIPLGLRFGLKAPVGGEGIRAKGGPVLEYYVKRDGQVQPGQAAGPYRQGDELQFVYAAGGYPYVTLASVDSHGHVSLYRPEGGNAPLSHTAAPGERQPLPFGVTLDDSPGAELFVMIYGSGPLAGDAVERWLTEAYTRASGNLEGIASLLAPPPGPSASSAPVAAKAGKAETGKDHAAVRTLLLRKTQA